MIEQPAWLPEILQLNPWTNDKFEELYKIFIDTFVTRKPRYRGDDIFYFPEQENGKIALFWHCAEGRQNTRGKITRFQTLRTTALD